MIKSKKLKSKKLKSKKIKSKKLKSKKLKSKTFSGGSNSQYNMQKTPNTPKTPKTPNIVSDKTITLKIPSGISLKKIIENPNEFLKNLKNMNLNQQNKYKNYLNAVKNIIKNKYPSNTANSIHTNNIQTLLRDLFKNRKNTYKTNTMTRIIKHYTNNPNANLVFEN